MVSSRRLVFFVCASMVCAFMVWTGCEKRTAGRPQFGEFSVTDLDVLKPGNPSPAVLDQLIRSAGGPLEYNCPWWSPKCWCDGGAGSTDCNNLVASGKCGTDATLDTAPQAGAPSLAGTCNRAPGQSPCPGDTGAC